VQIRALTLILLLIWNVACLAQHERQFTFVHYGTDKGLQAYDVTGVIQDDAGYIWTATVSGLQRFDGTRFITFRHHPEDPLSIPENHIVQLIRDSNKNLWILTAFGHIGILDTRHLTFKKVAVQPSRATTLLSELLLFADSRGNVFLL
jgi:ligand-binding sensor domain-containing protein